MGDGSADWQRLCCLLSMERLGRLAETLLFTVHGTARQTGRDFVVCVRDDMGQLGRSDWQRLIRDTKRAKPQQHIAIA